MLRNITLALLLGLVAGTSLATEHQVTIGDYFFDPQNVTINSGDTIVWTNKGNHTHSAYGQEERWYTGELDTDDVSKPYTFTKSQDYLCFQHPDPKKMPYGHIEVVGSTSRRAHGSKYQRRAYVAPSPCCCCPCY
jgi:plastocyanin